MCALTSSPRRVVRSFIGVVEPLLLLFLGRLLLLHRLTPFSNRCSEPHRLTAEMLGLVRPLALVVQKIDVELGQRGDLEPASLEHARKDTGVIGRQEVTGALGSGGPARAELT